MLPFDVTTLRELPDTRHNTTKTKIKHGELFIRCDKYPVRPTAPTQSIQQMQSLLPRTCASSSRAFTAPLRTHINRTSIATMSTGVPNPSSNLNIETKDIKTAPGVSLSENQSTVLRSILDLFAGRPSLPKLALWRDDATFSDPITVATGRDRFAAQWYGLQQAFSSIERLHHEVTDAGNPMLMDLKTKYVIKGIGKEQVVSSVVAVHLDESGKISKVEDKWDGKLPEGSIANVSTISDLVSPVWWVNYWIAWGWWLWSFTWETRVWMVGAVFCAAIEMVLVCERCRTLLANFYAQAFRHLNAVTVPKIVSVPKNEAEDAKKGN